MNSMHSKGPWKLRFDSEGTFAEIDSCEWTSLAKVVIKMDDDKFLDYVGLSNSRLIASAPELLDACKEALNAFWGTSESPGQDEAIESLKNAIAMATGK